VRIDGLRKPLERPASLHTTEPGENSLTGRRQSVVAGIQWLFPGTGKNFTPLEKDRTVLGRDSDSDAELPGAQTSRHHAEIVRDGPIVYIRDLESRNGVFEDGQRTAQAPLVPGSVLRLGDWLGLVVDDGYSDWQGGTIAPGVYGGPKLRAVLERARLAAAGDLPIVIEGETGTGKEVVARALHAWSGRTGPFLAVNCGALPEALAEAELFGYRRGAFTGAERASLGHLRAAHLGTLLLDEITDLPLSLQPKLLRALEQREVVPLGESQPVKIDVKVLVATQEPLERVVFEKRFRADLCARLEGFTLKLPPLRERIEDVPQLFARLLQESGAAGALAVEARLIERLCLYDWPFNVRELVLLARRLSTLHGKEPCLRAEHLPERIRRSGSKARTELDAKDEPRAARRRPRDPDRAERELGELVEALREHRGNVASAAARVGISRQRAYRLMGEHPELDLESLRNEPASSRGGGREH
jgi:transcriptional regulator of acetoin/glycerol metabolism